MEILNLKSDIHVFGIEVSDFPHGIGEAFDSLIKIVPEGFGRPYYGISFKSPDEKMVYLATAEEKTLGEAEKYNCRRYVIEKGDYLTVTIRDWRTKTDSIKDVFHQMVQDDRADCSKPCVELYKNDDEMICMVKVKKQTNLHQVS